MSSVPSITATYSAETTTGTANSAENTSGSLTFETPILLSNDGSGAADDSAQTKKELYLEALAKALSTIQESINTKLTERLVQQGVLSETTDKDPSVNTKLRTKVPGQPNNSKKGQTKKQQQRQQQGQEQEQEQGQEQEQSTKEITKGKEQNSNPSSSDASTTVTPTLEGASISSATIPVATPSEDVEMKDDNPYRPKGGIYGDDDEEAEQREKDEVDLVMEADPGEVDGACLELPKEQQQTNKKRNDMPIDNASQLTTAKKSKGSDD
ncbi:hypothetical protein BCR41DRAFT_357822, partial [Lobosporangium transversale]